MSFMKFYIAIFMVIAFRGGSNANDQGDSGNQTEKGKQKILITHPDIPKTAFAIFGDKYELRISKNAEGSNSPSRDILLKDIQGVDAVMWFGHVHVDEEMISSAGPQLKVVGSMGAGYDHISVELLHQKGIKVSNTPDILSSAVADMAVGLTLAASRNIIKGYNAILENKWVVNHPTWMCGPALQDATVGIVGLGAIGMKIAQRIKSFDIKELLYYSPRKRSADQEQGAKYVTLNELLEKSDFVFLSVPLTKDTTHLINKDNLKLMKKSSILINTARGGVVNQEDLVEALKNGVIGGAALDVTSPEPLPPNHELTKLPNVVLTPHISSATFLARETMAKMAAQNIYNVLNGQELQNPIPIK